uniref:Uncharacterized protein n=1 Tax=Ciona intestinalis TaxID=7719 RepID=H2XLQ9_CIOIN
MNKSALFLLLLIGLFVLAETNPPISGPRRRHYPPTGPRRRWQWNQIKSVNIEDLSESLELAEDRQ